MELDKKTASGDSYAPMFPGFEITPDRIARILSDGPAKFERPNDKKVMLRVLSLAKENNHALILAIMAGHIKECEISGIQPDQGLIDRCIRKAIATFEPRKAES